jgi:hypothetical protein
MTRHLCDNGADRLLGQRWERGFCVLAARAGRTMTAHQLGRDGMAASWAARDGGSWRVALLPDVTLWTAPGEHHEIKHKDATRDGRYGLEAYRLEALVRFRLETSQHVFLTIHDWRLAGAAHPAAPMPNAIEHWRIVEVLELVGYVERRRLAPRAMPTYVAGRPAVRPGYYWPTALWRPLAWWWRV